MDPQDHTLLNDSLIGFTEFRKAVILMVTVYYSKRIHIKISQGKKHTGWSPGKTRTSLEFSPSEVTHKVLNFPRNKM